MYDTTRFYYFLISRRSHLGKTFTHLVGRYSIKEDAIAAADRHVNGYASFEVLEVDSDAPYHSEARKNVIYTVR